VHSRSVVKISYKHQDDYSVDQISRRQKKCHMDMFQLSNYDILYCSDLHEAFTVFQTKLHLKSSITLSMMKSRKEEMISPIHISTDEQISRHFGNTSIQDERVCVLKPELVETTSFLLEKEEMTVQVRREH
jgi:hypothetical protein